VCVLLVSAQLACGSAARPDAGPDGSAAAAVPADDECLRALAAAGVAYRPAQAGGGMHTPVELTGPVGPVTLVPLGRPRPVMDCRLARALYDAREVFASLQIQELRFSAAFDYRTRRDSDRLSAHAFGLAIDVHELGTASGVWSVLRDFEVGVGMWKGLRPDGGALPACVGNPQTEKGRALRTLACRLKLHPAFAVIVTPDDNSDHRNHLHIEARADFFPIREGATLPLPPPPPTRAGDGDPRPSVVKPVRRRGKPKHKITHRRKTRLTKKRARVPAAP
jgi:hypothetical protein